MKQHILLALDLRVLFNVLLTTEQMSKQKRKLARQIMLCMF